MSYGLSSLSPGRREGENEKILYSHGVNTPLGKMLALASAERLVLLEFEEQKNLSFTLAKLSENFTLAPQKNEVLRLLENELGSYFEGRLKTFTTPLAFFGTEFQKLAWNALLRVNYGETKSYAEQALAIGRPKAFRAVANANAANNVSIVVPCHRIINGNGALGGYAGGIAKKKWLLNHEKKHS